jgi:hypothetical protein
MLQQQSDYIVLVSWFPPFSRVEIKRLGLDRLQYYADDRSSGAESQSTHTSLHVMKNVRVSSYFLTGWEDSSLSLSRIWKGTGKFKMILE